MSDWTNREHAVTEQRDRLARELYRERKGKERLSCIIAVLVLALLIMGALAIVAVVL